MPQDRESGARANTYGRQTAKKVAERIGAKSITKTSNEFELQGRRITIRCARYSNSNLGASYKMLKRVDAVFAALEQEDGEYKLYEISPSKFKENMRPTRSKGPAAGRVGLVRRSVFVNEGRFVRSLRV